MQKELTVLTWGLLARDLGPRFAIIDDATVNPTFVLGMFCPYPISLGGQCYASFWCASTFSQSLPHRALQGYQTSRCSPKERIE